MNFESFFQAANETQAVISIDNEKQSSGSFLSNEALFQLP
jgi:hypothetical protein